MRKDEIKHLLEKYYRAETTVDEEADLKEYFRNNSDIQGYEAEKEMFGYFSATSDIPMPDNKFEERIISNLRTGSRTSPGTRRRNLIISLSGVAASVLIIAGVNFLSQKMREPADTFTDPETAYAAAMDVLFDVSSRMNRATQAMQPVSKLNEITVKTIQSVSKPATMFEEKLNVIDQITVRLLELNEGEGVNKK